MTEEITCSGAHSDSNPAASAACTMFRAASGVGNPVLAKTIPHFTLETLTVGPSPRAGPGVPSTAR